MPRYIDADRLMTKIHELYVQPNVELWQVVKCVGNSPTADVVPKSEVENIISNQRQRLNEYKKQIVTLQEKLEQAKAEVAKEFIDAVDAMLDLVCVATGLDLAYIGEYAELKKKYTEGESNGSKQ